MDDLAMTHAKRLVVYWNQVWSQGDPDAPQRFYAEGATENGVPVQASAFAAGAQSWREKEAEGRLGALAAHPVSISRAPPVAAGAAT